MTTRRKFGLGIAAIIAAQRAPAALVRSLVAARAALTGGKKLPYDAEVEWLGSNGIDFITTGVPAGRNVGFEISGRLTSPPVPSMLFGVAVNDWDGYIASYDFAGQQCEVFYYTDDDEFYAVFSTNPGEDFVWSFNFLGNMQTMCDSGSALSQTITLLPPASLSTAEYAIFSLGTTEGHDGTAATGSRIYYAKLSDGATLVRDFLPVRVGTSGFLYDRVSGQLFGNGNFPYGNDVYRR